MTFGPRNCSNEGVPDQLRIESVWAVHFGAGRRNLGAIDSCRPIQCPFLLPRHALIPFHFLRFETLDFFLTLLKSGSLSACHTGSFRCDAENGLGTEGRIT